MMVKAKMPRKSKRIFNILLLVFILFSFLNPCRSRKTFSQESENLQDQKNTQSVTQNLKSSKDYEEEINFKKSKISEISSKIEEIEKSVEDLSKSKKSVQDEINVIDSAIKKSELEIMKLASEIEITNLEISSLDTEIEEKRKEIQKQGQFLETVALKIYEIGSPSFVDIFLGFENLSDYIQKSSNLKMLNDYLITGLKEMKVQKAELESKRRILKLKKDELAEYKRMEEVAKYDLENQKFTKETFLSVYLKKESEYQELLRQARIEQQNIFYEISSLEEVRKKAEEEKKKSSQNNPFVQPIKNDVDVKLSWPLPVSGRISATFLDEDYKKSIGIDHFAIDIAVPQGTKILAPEDGVVRRVLDAGYGYNFLFIEHSDGIGTGYGHVSQFLVSEGQSVKKGDVVALTGGAPGTKELIWLFPRPKTHDYKR